MLLYVLVCVRGMLLKQIAPGGIYKVVWIWILPITCLLKKNKNSESGGHLVMLLFNI